MRFCAAILLSSLSACASRASKPVTIEGSYRFTPGDVITYKVESGLFVDMSGTHPDFLMMGKTNPVSWGVDGTFENIVVEVKEDGPAFLERRVRQIDSTGHALEEEIGFAWSRDMDGKAPDESKISGLLNRFVASMVSIPMPFVVQPQGNTTVTEWADMNRLVMRRGMMYWPLSPGETAWTSHESIAVPVLHDKLRITFANETRDRRGSVVRVAARPSLDKVEASPFALGSPEYSVDGKVAAYFDEAAGRLNELKLELRLSFFGKAPLPGGGEGDIRGTVTYVETQRLVQ